MTGRQPAAESYKNAAGKANAGRLVVHCGAHGALSLDFKRGSEALNPGAEGLRLLRSLKDGRRKTARLG
jgi:hypothetical protein